MKFAAFFGKLWLKTQSAMKKVWTLAKLHKVISIASAATVVAGTTCAIALPVALHNHEYSAKWTFDTESHWHEASCKHDDERSDVAPHTYANSCDMDCDVCGKTRSINHTYDNACDTTCNVCEKVRDEVYHVFFNVCDTDCNICGATREVGAHVYDDTCDTICNACGAEREITHTFDNACDTECNICDYTRKTEHNYIFGSGNNAQHWYECTGCGDILYAANHTYDNECDTTCNNCGKEREIEHTYSVSMYKNADKHWYECTICGVKKSEEAHYYTDACDASCDACNAIREVPEHVYDNNCDVDCNVCGGVREIEHAYEIKFTDDKHWYECDVCHVTKDDAAHYYSHSCDTTCNKCGAERTVDEHPYKDTYTTSSSHHWFECTVCKERKDVAEHVYTSACDATCNTCEYVREVNPHVYDNACDTICNVENCGYEREVAPHPYAETYATDATNHWRVCEICADIAYVSAHEHDNACDTDCNVCGMTREVPEHVYDNDCDKTCNVCGAVREVPEHPYSETYTTDTANHWFVCEECGNIDYVAAHEHDNACDTDCNVCGMTREVPAHVYDNDCDKICNICEDVREVEPHVYTNSCDTTCNVCGNVRAIEHKYVLTKDADNHWNECSVCHDKIDVAAHGYTSDCDTTCNVCGYVRTVNPHVYTNDCDTICNVENCGYEREVEPHIYDNDCDAKCNICDAEREVPAHDYVIEYNNDSHWEKCIVCGYKTAEQAHKCSPCDGKCNSCDFQEVKDVYEHPYSEEYVIGTGEEAGYHWRECTADGCESITDKALHYNERTSDDEYHWSKVCVCGYDKNDKESHIYTEEYDGECHYEECSCGKIINEEQHDLSSRYDDDAHWEVCSACDYKTPSVPHEFSFTKQDDDSHLNSCECGHNYTSNHNYSEEYENGDNGHWLVCEDCGHNTDVSAHKKVWGYDEKYHYYYCEVCDYEYTRSQHEFAVKYEIDKHLAKSATEDSEAEYYLVCGPCYRQDKENAPHGEETWTKSKINPDIKIYAFDKTYDGKALSFYYSIDKAYSGKVDVWYKLKGQDDSAYQLYTEDVIIVNAGEYVIKVTAKQTVDYYGGEVTKDVTISKATITLTWITPDSIYDGTDKTASVVIKSGVVGSENVSVIAECISGDTTKQNQTIVYEATLVGSTASNYVISNETVEYTIDPCAHTNKDNYGFCTLCGEYGGITIEQTKENNLKLSSEELEGMTVLYVRFGQFANNQTNLGYYLNYAKNSSKLATFKAYYVTQHTFDSDGVCSVCNLNETSRNKHKDHNCDGFEEGHVCHVYEEIRLRERSPYGITDITDDYIYLVITIDESIESLNFTLYYKPIEDEE